MKCDKENGSCECNPGYEGETCDRKMTTTIGTTVDLAVVFTAEPKKHLGAAVGGMVGGVVIIGVLVVMAVYLYRRKYVSFIWQLDIFKRVTNITCNYFIQL